MRFEITVLGSGSALPSQGRHHSAQILNIHEQYYLVDCGEGTQMRLKENGINPLKINAIFISHLHGDHLYGLFPLLSTLSLMGRKTPLKIFAPNPFQQLLESVTKYMDDHREYEIEYHEVDTRKNEMIYQNRVMEVWTIPLRHRVPASGFLFKEKVPPLNVHKEMIQKYDLGLAQIVAAKRGETIEIDGGEILTSERLTYTPYQPRSYAYCSDTSRSGKVTKLVEGVDLLYHETTFANDDISLARETGHTTTGQAAEIAKQAQVERLLIGHFSGRYQGLEPLLSEAQAIFPNTTLAYEGLTVAIPLNRLKGDLL